MQRILSPDLLHDISARYTGCPVTYQSGQLSGQATTNNAGAFSIPVTGATNFANGLISLPADSPNCVDALTKLPPPFSLGALVPAGKGESTSSSLCDSRNNLELLSCNL